MKLKKNVNDLLSGDVEGSLRGFEFDNKVFFQRVLGEGLFFDVLVHSFQAN
jgi:hypothetical protein